MAYMRKHESAQLIWDALAKAGQKGLTFREIQKKTDLTRSQVLYGFQLVKDTLMEAYEQPLAYDHTTYRYCLPDQWQEVGDYIDFRVLGILTMARRLEHVTNASALKWGKTPAVKTAAKHVTRLREDLEELAGIG